MLDAIPRPESAIEFELAVARFARSFLGNPLADLYGTSGDRQYGVDVLGYDQQGALWAFQAKCRKRFSSSDLDREIARLRQWNRTPRNYVVLTTCEVTRRTHDAALRTSEQLGFNIAVWGWTSTEARLREWVGGAHWLPDAGRCRLRNEYLQRVRGLWQDARVLDPLLLEDAALLTSTWMEPEVVDVNPVPMRGPSPSQNGERGGVDAGDVSFRSTEGLPARLRAVRAGHRPFFLLQGEAGTGKSMALLQAAEALAQDAVEDPRRPLPLIIRASGALNHTIDSWIEDARLGGLWQDPLTRWIVLVDGMDEIPLGSQTGVASQIEALANRDQVVALVVACRTSHVSQRLLPKAWRIALSPWRRDQLAVLAGQDAGTLPRSISTPEDAALYRHCLSTGSSNRFRWSLRDAMLRITAQKRACEGELLCTLEEVCWHLVLKGGSEHRRILEARVSGNAGQAIDHAVRDLGFVKESPQDILTAIRLTHVENLASRALSRREVAQIWNAATRPETTHTARIAMARRAVRDPAVVGQLLACTSKQDDARLEPLVGMAALLGAVLDLGDDVSCLPEAALDSVIECMSDLALDETSRTRRQVGQQWISAFARQQGPVWGRLLPLLEPLLHSDWSRASWFEQKIDFDAEPCDPELVLRFLEHCLCEEDEEVRAWASSRLHRWRNHPEGRSLLLAAVMDGGCDMHTITTPGIAAALVLREAERDAEFERVRRTLVKILGWHQQFPSGAAAVALRPGEAPASDLLAALRFHFQSTHAPAVQNAIQDLAGTPDGGEWLSRNPMPEHPAWEHPPAPIPESPLPERDPCSRRVRAELAKCMAPGFTGLADWRRLPRDVRTGAWFHAALMPEVPPHLLADLLAEMGRERIPPFFWPQTQEALGRAALADASVADVILGQWKRIRRELPSSYPGIALEPLALAGGRRARRILAEWVQESPFIGVLGEYRPFPPEVLALPTVRKAAQRAARTFWERAAGSHADGKGLWCGTMGAALGALWPSWADDTEMIQALVARALLPGRKDRAHEWFNAALSAWWQGDLPQELQVRLVANLRGWRKLRKKEQYLLSTDVPLWMEAADRMGLGQALVDVWWDLFSNVRGAATYQAADLLCRSVREEAAEISEKAALLWPGLLGEDRYGSDPVSRLVAHAPAAWTERLEGSMNQPVSIPLATYLLGLSNLDAGLRRRVTAVLQTISLGYPLPWIRTGRGMACGRLSEEAMLLLLASVEMALP